MTSGLLASISAGTMVDIAIAVVALIFIIVNVCKGFVKQVFGIIATIGSLIIAYYLCSWFADLVNSQFGWRDKLAASILNGFKDNSAFNASLSEENVRAAVDAAGLPQLIGDIAVKLIGTMGGAEMNVAQFLSAVIAKYVFLTGAYIILFIVFRLILGLVKFILLKIVSLPILNGINRLLGLVLGVIKALFYIYLVIYIINVLPSSVSFIAWLKNAIAESSIVKIINAESMMELFGKLISGLIK